VAGASHGSLTLLLFGLGLSIPLVIFASALISKLMERFTIVVWIGAAILGKVAGEMIVTDPWIVKKVWLSFQLVEYKGDLADAAHSIVFAAEGIGVCIVLLTGLLWQRVSTRKNKCAALTNGNTTDS